MLIDGIDRKSDDLDMALAKLRLELGHVADLGSAYRREILRMREQAQASKTRHNSKSRLVVRPNLPWLRHEKSPGEIPGLRHFG
jgi:hypothetical protein